MSLALPLLLVLAFACLALTRAAPTAEEEATNSGTSPRRVEFALRANTTRDLSGIWSSADQDGNTNLVKFVQQGNQLVMPSNRNPAIPYQVTITLYGGYGLGKGALWANPTFFCSFVRYASTHPGHRSADHVV
jgi:hypothetical protein